MTACAKCHYELAPGALSCSVCGTAMPSDQPSRETDDPLIGRTFRGVYFVQRKIGGGGMGQVYQAVHVKLDVPVALKILRRDLLGDEVALERFHREARAASRLRHPNIISVTDFGETEDGNVFMVMEYVAGKNLARIIAEESPLSERRIVRIASQILAGLTEAHRQQILHRDLKPANVMVDSRSDEPDFVKLLDFGIAKGLKLSDGQGGLTQTGIVCGTPGYMSPEQWEAVELDARSDLYSVGALLYEMLTGSLPYQAQTPMQLMRKYLTESLEWPSQRRPDRPVSPDLEALVMRALSPEPAERPASAQEMREELQACVLLAESADETPGAPKTVALPRAVSARPTPRRAAAPSPSPETPGAAQRVSTPRKMPSRPAMTAPAETSPSTTRRFRTPLLIAGTAGAMALVAVAAFLAGGGGFEKGDATAPLPVIPQPAPVAPAPPTPPSPEPVIATPTPTQEPDAAPSVNPVAKPPSSPPTAPLTNGDGAAQEPRRPAPRKIEVSDHLNAFKLPSPASGLGLLTVTADPSGYVTLDGRSFGETPREFRLPAGAYRVRVVHPKLGKRETVARITPGQRARWTADFMK